MTIIVGQTSMLWRRQVLGELTMTLSTLLAVDPIAIGLVPAVAFINSL